MRSYALLAMSFLLGACGSAVLAKSPPSESMASFRASESPAEPAQANSPTTEVTNPRKLIINGNLRIKGLNLEDLEKAIVTRTTSLGGYISSTYSRPDSLIMEIRIPAELLDDFLDFAEGLGRLESKSLTTQDITNAYTDLETRIQNQQALVGRIRRYLAEAKTIQEILEVERTLNEVTSELESMLRQKQGWDRDIAYSQLTVELVSGATNQLGDWPDLGEGFANLGLAIVWFFYGLLFVLIYLVLFGTPIAAIVLGLLWILFGKNGVVRKIFFSNRKNQSGQNS